MKYDKPYLKHILDEINFIIDKSENLEYENLLQDETLKRAFLRSLEVIGEATKNLSKDLRKSHPEVEWKGLTGLRDILIHKYFGILWDNVWDVIKNKIPAVKEKIESIIKQIENNENTV